MSSHHFVKEGQEPALIIAGQLNYEKLEGLLEWAPTIVVLPGAVDGVISHGIKADVIIVEENRYQEMLIRASHQMPVKILAISASEDPFTTALDYLHGSKQAAVNVWGVTKKSFFRTAEAYLSRIQISLFENNIKWSAVTSGKFEKWLPADSKLWLKHESAISVSKGSASMAGSEVSAEKDGIVSLSSHGFFWVGEPIN